MRLNSLAQAQGSDLFSTSASSCANLAIRLGSALPSKRFSDGSGRMYTRPDPLLVWRSSLPCERSRNLWPNVMYGVDLGAPFITSSVRYTKAQPPSGVWPALSERSRAYSEHPLRAATSTYVSFAVHAPRFQYLIGSVALSILGAFFVERINKLLCRPPNAQALF